MSQVCRTCGKEFVVLYPHLWAYRTGTNYFCSWKCLRAEDGQKGVERKMAGEKVNTAMKREAVEIAIAGGDPRPYLKECGSTSPDKLWYHIKKTMQEKDPETYAKIPDLRSLKKKNKEPQKKVETELIINDEMIQIRKKAPITRPINLDGLEVSAVRHKELGEFYYDSRMGCIDWRTREGCEVTLQPEGWKSLAKELPKILGALGVEQNEG